MNRPNVYEIIMATKISLGSMNVHVLPNDSLPKVVIVGLSVTYGNTAVDIIEALGGSVSEFNANFRLFRKACVACSIKQATAEHHQIVEAAYSVDRTIKLYYVRKDLVEVW